MLPPARAYDGHMPTFAESVAAGGHAVGSERNEPIDIEPYDPAWPQRFDDMRTRLAVALGATALRIDHVGSTAIVGLAAKPIIDIQISVPDVEDEGAYKNAIESQGLGLRWIEPAHRYFRPPPRVPRLFHVHVCSAGSDWERAHLLFRDYLRAHPKVAAEYEHLKRRLATEHRDERIAYTDAKGPFVEDVLRRAGEWELQARTDRLG